MRGTRLRSKLLFGITLTVVLTANAWAQDYPSRPIRWVDPFSPGGSSDLISRLIAQRLSDRFGQPVIVENRPGASGNIAVAGVAKAAPDGYTLVTTGKNILTINPHLSKNPPFDAQADFAPISILATSAQVLAVHPSVKASNLREFIALAKSRPGQMNFGSGGRGTTSHLNGEMLKSMAGIDIVHVPYKGGAPTVTALLSGEIHSSFADLIPVMPHIKAGRLRPLAVTDDRRVCALAKVPTMSEAGLPGYSAQQWWALLAPKGTPDVVVKSLNEELGGIAKMPDVIAKYQRLGITAAHSTLQEMKDRIKADSVKMKEILKVAGVQPE